MANNETLYTLALKFSKDIGDITARKLIEACGSASEVFSENKEYLYKIPNINKRAIYSLTRQSKDSLVKAEKEIEISLKKNIDIWTISDKRYPKNLRHCHDAPVLLFTKGNIDINKKKILSVVGTRKMTSYGRDFCKKIIGDIKRQDLVIVSGMAYGVDICAHEQTLNNNLLAVAILGHGLNEIYPKAHYKEAMEIAEKGLLITEFPFYTSPKRENFPKRNRIIAGISEGIVVVESPLKGGAIITADLSNSYNREVFAVPGRSTDLYSQGCNWLISKNKANIFYSYEDMEKHLNWDCYTNDNTQIKPTEISLNKDEEDIISLLQSKGKLQIDQIVILSKKPSHIILDIMFNLELKGLITSSPGKFFESKI
ncbi:DNA-processing protein DprA [Ichthyobacterium seriolicida]|uniref:DNA processing protein DprA n=1 Tax=Ichthyobacterium seriolicida TaxID=242600 RepID=A0A1J1E3P3_9FLAO|nr:DNA-processing protein DprA [Ichthyobacterium seriolicida]BAV94668.1 DNA processing protein DprA [Ichthyobacterium seriolicida]